MREPLDVKVDHEDEELITYSGGRLFFFTTQLTIELESCAFFV